MMIIGLSPVSCPPSVYRSLPLRAHPRVHSGGNPRILKVRLKCVHVPVDLAGGGEEQAGVGTKTPASRSASGGYSRQFQGIPQTEILFMVSCTEVGILGPV